MRTGFEQLWRVLLLVGVSSTLACDRPMVEDEVVEDEVVEDEVVPGDAPPTPCTIADECLVPGQLRLCSPFTGLCVTGSCSATEDCAAGYICDVDDGLCRFGPACDGDAACGDGVCWAFGGESGSECGSACSAPPTLDEPCLILDDGPNCFNRRATCAAGLECFVEHLAIASLGTCIVPRSAGEPCGGSAVDEDGCDNALTCAGGGISGEPFNGTCEVPAPVGALCLRVDGVSDERFRHDCATGLTCVDVEGDETPAESRCQ